MKMKILIAATLLLAATVSVRAADVEANWKKHCASCHGADGKGKTRAGRMAKVKDLTDAKYQESFTEEKMTKQIKEGMKVDDKEVMKPFAEKLNDEEIKELVAFVRKFKK